MEQYAHSAGQSARDRGERPVSPTDRSRLAAVANAPAATKRE